jgi:hypothetical protein
MDMNCNLPVYREAYKLFEGTPREVWSVLWLLERYVNGAIAQIDRIHETTHQMSEYHRTWLHDQLFLDVHSYFICWDKAQNLLKHLVKVHPDPNLLQLWERLRLFCKPFNDSRNHLEHIDERLAKNPNETGSLAGDFFIFAGERFDISDQGLNALTGAYEEVIRMITVVDASGQSLPPDQYERLPWKPTIGRELPGRRR